MHSFQSSFIIMIAKLLYPIYNIIVHHIASSLCCFLTGIHKLNHNEPLEQVDDTVY